MITPTELVLIVIAIAILLIWGPSKIPGLARAIGQAIYEFRRSTKGLVEEEEEKTSEEKKKTRLNTSDVEKVYELAKKLGIETEGKSVAQIVEEIEKRLQAKTEAR